MGKRTGTDKLILLAAVLGSLVLVNILGAHFFGRADLTRDGQFTLSRASVDTLQALEDPVTVRAYFTRDLPPMLASRAHYVKDLLDEYYAQGGGNFRYEFIDPTSEETEEDQQKKKNVKKDIFGRLMREKTSVEKELERLGIRPVHVRVNEADKMVERLAYMGIAVQFGDEHEVIPLVQSTADLEYKLTTMVRKVSRKRTPKVALVTGHDNPEQEMSGVLGLLRQLYEVTTVDLSQKAEIGDDVDAILVVGPRNPFAEGEKKAIDRFVMSGRSAAFLLGPVAPDLQNLQANPIQHGLGGLLASYGVKLAPGLVLDAACATIPVTRQQGSMRVTQQVRYPFILLPRALDAGHPLTRGLARVSFPFMGPLVLQSLPGVETEVLVKSSDKGWIHPEPYNLDPFHRWTLAEAGDLKQHDLVVTLSGAIPGHFTEEGADGPATAESARVLVVNGHAFLLDRFMSKGNQAFVLNLMDWLVMDEALLAVRSRGLAAVPLDELTDGGRYLARYLNVIGLPLAFIGFGLIRWRLRESRRKRVSV